MSDDFDDPFTSNPDQLADQLGPLLWRCANLWKRTQARQLRNAGLPPTQDRVLWLLTLLRPGKAQRSVDIARALRIHPVVVARIVRAFEREGLLTRTREPPEGSGQKRDGRERWLSLTEAGREKAETARLASAVGVPDFFAPLGVEHAGLARLLRVLLRTHDPDRELPRSLRARRSKPLKTRAPR